MAENATTTPSAPAKKKASHRPFLVAPGCGIAYTAPDGSTKRGRDGDKVMLNAKQAKQFNDAGYLRPHIADDADDAGDESGEGGDE